MDFLFYVLLTLFLVLSAFLVLLVLIQKGRGGGLASAFGGVGGNTAFGAKTGDVLTWATSIVFGVFLLLAIGLNLIANHRHDVANRLTNDVSADTAPTTVTPTTPMLPPETPATPAPAAPLDPAGTTAGPVPGQNAPATTPTTAPVGELRPATTGPATQP
jgi:preprotein translocase subunit SecG